MDQDLTFLNLQNGRSEGTIVLKLNDIVRKVVKARLIELEDTIVSFCCRIFARCDSRRRYT